MRWFRIVSGVVITLIGGLWMLQGLNVVGGSRMTGEPFWIWIGLVVIALGLFLLYRAIRQLLSDSAR